MRDTVVQINGVAGAQLSTSDRGLNYGHGLFETMRMSEAQIPLLALHLDRISRGATALSIPLQAGLLQTSLNRFLPQCPADGVVKMIVTAGDSGRGYRISGKIEPTTILQFMPAPTSPESTDLQVSAHRLPLNPELAGIKHLNRLDQVIGSRGLSADCDGLMLDALGNVIEALSSNIFCRFGRQWLTPSLMNSGIAGVMRRLLLEDLFPELGDPVEIADVSLANLIQAEEMFVCNSVRGITPVRSLRNSEGDLMVTWSTFTGTDWLQQQLWSRYPCYRS